MTTPFANDARLLFSSPLKNKKPSQQLQTQFSYNSKQVPSYLASQTYNYEINFSKKSTTEHTSVKNRAQGFKSQKKEDQKTQQLDLEIPISKVSNTEWYYVGNRSEIKNEERYQSINCEKIWLESCSSCNINRQQQFKGLYQEIMTKVYEEYPEIYSSSPIKCVGRIISHFENSTQVIQATAFLISPRILVTGLHAIFDPTTQNFIKKAEFIPNGSTKEVYQTENVDFIRIQSGAQPLKCYEQVTPYDYAVLILEAPVLLSNYFKLTSTVLKSGDNLQIWDCLNEKISQSISPQTLQNKNILSGKFVSSIGNGEQKYGLVHTIQTKKGHSGSPIIKTNDISKINLYQVVGIHTHQGINSETNQGLQFSKDNIANILKLAIELSQIHKNPESQIKQLPQQLHKLQKTQNNVKQVLIIIKES